MDECFDSTLKSVLDADRFAKLQKSAISVRSNYRRGLITRLELVQKFAELLAEIYLEIRADEGQRIQKLMEGDLF